MIGVLLPAVFASLSTPPAKPPWAAALREATNEFYLAEPYPLKDNPAWYLSEATRGYRKILHLYGNVSAARAGLARCLYYQGFYREAAIDFDLAGKEFAARAHDAENLATLAESICRKLRGESILSVIRIPDSRIWVALWGTRGTESDWNGSLNFGVRIVVGSSNRKGSLNVLGSRTLGIPPHTGGARDYDDSEEDGPGSAAMYLMHRSIADKQWSAVIYRQMPAADCEPAAVIVADVTPHGLRRVTAFGSLQGISVYPPKGEQGLTVFAAPTFKVWWPDTYEWKRGRFVFANAQHPALYTDTPHEWTEDETEHYYPLWMERAAVYGIHVQYAKALHAWRRAKRSCEKTIRTKGDQGSRRKSEYHDHGFYGQARINLKEIRKRIRWLKKGEHNHPLLYRPYDFDLQVPPYRLGPAVGVQYGG